MIKATYELLERPGRQSFLIRKFDKTAYEAPFHFHPEYELTYIIHGSGRRYAGCRLNEFATGDLVLLGPNVPHCWKLDPSDDNLQNAGAVVIQFAADFLGESFFEKEELQHINLMLKKSEAGICFTGEVRDSVNLKMLELTNETDQFTALISFLEILNMLATSKGYVLLDKHREAAEQLLGDQERVGPVFAYLIENFRKQVSLEEVSSIAGMTPNAFCKFFKRTTRKTFMETVISYRLSYAIRQLVQTDSSISQIAFESGFGDVSHFHKTFKQKIKMSPLSYRKRFMTNLMQAEELTI